MAIAEGLKKINLDKDIAVTRAQIKTAVKAVVTLLFVSSAI